MITAEQLREEMRKQELSQTELAHKAKINPSIISRWLSGATEPSDITKERVALALGLVDEAPEPEIPGIVGCEPCDEDKAFDAIMETLGITRPEEPEEAPEPEPEPEPPALETLLLQLIQEDGVRVYANQTALTIALDVTPAWMPPALTQLLGRVSWAQAGQDDGTITAEICRDIVAGLIRRYKED